MDWIELAQDRDQWRALGGHGNEPSDSIKCWEFLSSCTVGGFSRRAQLHECVSCLAMAFVSFVLRLLPHSGSVCHSIEWH
jgi:hypothetical protein